MRPISPNHTCNASFFDENQKSECVEPNKKTSPHNETLSSGLKAKRELYHKKNEHFFGERGDTVRSYNGKFKLENGDEAVCRHLAVGWLERETMDYRLFTSQDGIDKLQLSEEKLKSFYNNSISSTFDQRDFGAWLKFAFEKAIPGKPYGALIETGGLPEGHSLAIKYKVKKEGDQLRYVVSAFDPNVTTTHSRTAGFRLEELTGKSVGHFFKAGLVEKRDKSGVVSIGMDSYIDEGCNKISLLMKKDDFFLPDNIVTDRGVVANRSKIADALQYSQIGKLGDVSEFIKKITSIRSLDSGVKHDLFHKKGMVGKALKSADMNCIIKFGELLKSAGCTPEDSFQFITLEPLMYKGDEPGPSWFSTQVIEMIKADPERLQSIGDLIDAAGITDKEMIKKMLLPENFREILKGAQSMPGYEEFVALLKRYSISDILENI
ncbi:ShET2/EspL2 family type III secretion system effector toxin [Caballeronia calidae]|nr:ShET2/EspL2 family type III secretion system effector toxin [Caballeronia calidae]